MITLPKIDANNVGMEFKFKSKILLLKRLKILPIFPYQEQVKMTQKVRNSKYGKEFIDFLEKRRKKEN